MPNKIVLISCWYGPLPWYFNYFVHSCNFNTSVDFFIITDNTVMVKSVPKNIKFIYKTLKEINNLASRKLRIKTRIAHPYKLCDFKPAYGFLFPELIEKYDFWGHADIDIVYGNIRNFVTDEILQTYDIISSRHDYITGTFCLFKNTNKINRLFMESKDYKTVLSSPENFCFDECNYLFGPLQNGASIFDFPDNIQSMTYVVQKAHNEGRLKAFFDFMIVEGNPGRIKWEKGRIIYRDEFEAMFYHLIKFKTECKRPKILDPIPDAFYFTPRKITDKKPN